MSIISIPLFIHTAISLFAIGAGMRAFLRYGGITGASAEGCIYLLTTIFTCTTRFLILSSGAFTKAHALGLVTLVILGIAVSTRAARLFGSASKAVETIAYSLTFFLQMIQVVTEISTHPPIGTPLISDPEESILQALIGALFVAFVAGTLRQFRQLKAAPPT